MATIYSLAFHLTRVALITWCSAASVGAFAADELRPCREEPDLTRFAESLPRTAGRLASGEPLTVVAIGSSSTAGAGASSPAASYPSRLAITLQQRFPGHPIIVLNRGVNGEDAGDMLNRFENSVVSEKPDLVLWQVGTNSVLHDQAVATLSLLIREGLARLKAIGTDVVLIDPQFAPQVLAKPEAEDIVKMMSAAAREADVDLFTRFAIMRRWREQEGISFDTFVSPDGLHLNDWSYACIAKLLGTAIAEAAVRVQSVSGTMPTKHNSSKR